MVLANTALSAHRLDTIRSLVYLFPNKLQSATFWFNYSGDDVLFFETDNQ